MLCAWPSWYRAWHVAEECACQQFFKCLEDHLIRESSGYFVSFCFVKIFCKMVMNQRHIMNMKEKCRTPDSVDKWNKYECRRPENAVSQLTCDFCSWSIVQCLIVCYVEVHSFEVHSFTNCLSFVAWFSTFKCFTLNAFDIVWFYFPSLFSGILFAPLSYCTCFQKYSFDILWKQLLNNGHIDTNCPPSAPSGLNLYNHSLWTAMV